MDSRRPQQTAVHSTQQSSAGHGTQNQQQQSLHRAQCAARPRGIIMSSADSSADYSPEAEASAGKGEVEVESYVS